MDEVGEALGERRTTVPRRDSDAAARDAVYLNIELIGEVRVREVARYEPSLLFFAFAAVQSSRCRRQLESREGPHPREDLAHP